mmetsp:Transcript_54107/g.159205  ORF Transcript_54107/g.159205 Transcript_54107/m.159205 type:complete len:274 (-) Transcript_54107:784-1605(-)
MAVWAASASFTVSEFLDFSPLRSTVASCTAWSSWASSLERSAVDSESIMISDLPFSTPEVSMSMSSDSLLRVILFLPSSVSQKPSCSASWLASSIRRVIMSSIIFFTLAKGSEASFCASRDRSLLFRRSPSDSRKAFTLLRGLMSLASLPVCTLAERRCWMRALAWPAWARARCFSEAPATSGEPMISTAFMMAWISSARRVCFSSKDIFFSLHSAVVSENIFSFSAFMATTAFSCFWSRAFFSALPSFSAVFSEASFSAFSMESVRSSTIML